MDARIPWTAAWLGGPAAPSLTAHQLSTAAALAVRFELGFGCVALRDGLTVRRAAARPLSGPTAPPRAGS